MMLKDADAKIFTAGFEFAKRMWNQGHTIEEIKAWGLSSDHREFVWGRSAFCEWYLGWTTTEEVRYAKKIGCSLEGAK